ncbi:MAG TPA: DUF1552 domain-containing protein [Blastocatellia bacterium]|nr:DUF1552 domain-containing protein [Blastocatellia bacterium]
MMIITKKHLPRRTFLKGMGVAVALPLLDSMTPALAGAPHKAPTRLIFGYVPNGIMMKDWTPREEGKDFEFSRILKPLEPFREDLLVLTGLAHRTGAGGAGDHARGGGNYLTGVRPKRTTGADLEVGISVDQVAARTLGSQTRLPSLELGCEATRLVGSCDAGYSCAYQSSLSWRTPSTPMPPEVNPRVVFERLFGSLALDFDPKSRQQLSEDRKSILDYVNERTHSLMGRLGPSDRRKIDEYLTAIREVEKRIERTEVEDRELPSEIEKPAGIPTSFADHMRLMHDLLTIALQADLTRVSTLLYSREGSSRSYPELGFTDGHHPITHHRNLPDLVEKVTRINCYHVEQFAYFVRKLKSIREGDGTLLDHCVVVYGSSISDGNLHSHENLPVIMLGRGNGSLNPGRHIKYPEGPPMTNLFLALLDRLGVPTDKLGDSTEQLGRLSETKV